MLADAPAGSAANATQTATRTTARRLHPDRVIAHLGRLVRPDPSAHSHETGMKAAVVGQFRVERDREQGALAHGDRMAVDAARTSTRARAPRPRARG